MGRIHLTRIPAELGFQILDLFIDGNGLGDSRDLAALALPGDLDWNQGVVLNGKAPLWLHTWAMDQCRPAPWLAVMDPRQGGIVVRTGERGPDVARVIPIERIERHLRVIAAGVDRRGRAARCPVRGTLLASSREHELTRRREDAKEDPLTARPNRVSCAPRSMAVLKTVRDLAVFSSSRLRVFA